MKLIYHGATNGRAFYGDKVAVVRTIPALQKNNHGDFWTCETVEVVNCDDEHYIAPSSWFHATEVSA